VAAIEVTTVRVGVVSIKVVVPVCVTGRFVLMAVS